MFTQICARVFKLLDPNKKVLPTVFVICVITLTVLCGSLQFSSVQLDLVLFSSLVPFVCLAAWLGVYFVMKTVFSQALFLCRALIEIKRISKIWPQLKWLLLLLLLALFLIRQV